MKVRKIAAASAPGYPSRRQLAQLGAVLSLSAIGLTGCATRGKIPGESVDATPPPPPREEACDIGGVPPLDPKSEPQTVTATHVVAPGETLYGLSRRYLGRGERWPEIAAANPGVSPKRLRPGTVLHLPAR